MFQFNQIKHIIIQLYKISANLKQHLFDACLKIVLMIIVGKVYNNSLYKYILINI